MAGSKHTLDDDLLEDDLTEEDLDDESDEEELEDEGLEEALLAGAVEPDPEDESEPAPDTLPVLSNWEWDNAGEKPRKRGVPLASICEDLYGLTAGWPKRVDKVLFVPAPEYRPRYLETPAQLLA